MRISAITPVTATGLFSSKAAENEWCACRALESAATPSSARTNRITARFIESSSNSRELPAWAPVLLGRLLHVGIHAIAGAAPIVVVADELQDLPRRLALHRPVFRPRP